MVVFEAVNTRADNSIRKLTVNLDDEEVSIITESSSTAEGTAGTLPRQSLSPTNFS